MLPGLRSDHPQVPEVAERGRELVRLFLPKLDAQLAANKFVAGDRFTVADITAVFLIRGVQMQKLDLSGCPNIERWFAEMSERPSFA